MATKKTPADIPADVNVDRSEELNQLQSVLEEYKNKYLRAIADYQNYERRVQEEKKYLRDQIRSETLMAFLPLLDHLEKAELFIKDPGLKMIKDQFVGTMKSLGVQEVELMGREFDPHCAEAIEVVPGDVDNIIVEVTRKAYSLNGTVIQHGLVKVSKQQ